MGQTDRVPREGLESGSLEVFRKRLGVGLRMTSDVEQVSLELFQNGISLNYEQGKRV